MNKLFRRFVAYTIDMMVIVLVVQSLSGIPQLNPQLDDYNQYYDSYMESYQAYASFKQDLVTAFSDNKLSEKEYQSLIEDHEEYARILNQYYQDNQLSEDNYEKLNEKIDDEYNTEYRQYYYQIEQNSILYFVIYLLAVVAYFVGFNKYTNGQTLGKKLMRLKIVNYEDASLDVPIWSYVVRSLFLYQPVYYIVKLIEVSFLDIDTYYTVTSIFYNIQYYLEILIILMIMIRIDGRGLQDILAKTRVILYDKNGKEVEEKFELMVSKKIKEAKEKKVIDGPSD